MKKLALTLALSLAGISAASAQQVYNMGSGKIIFQGSLTQSGCNVTFDGVQGGGFDNEKIIQMPAGLSDLYIAPIFDKTTEAFEALPDEAKRSTLLGGSGDLSIGIICPVTGLIDKIDKAIGNTAPTTIATNQATLIAVLDTKGKLAFINQIGGNEGGFVNAKTYTPGATSIFNGKTGNDAGVLKQSPTSSAKGIGIAFLRTNSIDPTGPRQFVNLTGAKVSEDLKWYGTTMINSSTGSPISVEAVATDATYDFAYVRLGGTETFIPGNGTIEHAVSFQFQYQN